MGALSSHLCLLGDANSVHIQRWAHEMQQRNYRVSVITARPHSLQGVEERVLRPIRRPFDWLWRVRETQAHLEALQPDIVHAHYVTSYGYLAARCGRKPLIMTAWGSDLLVTPRGNPVMGALTAWVLRQSDVITADSHDLLAAAQSYAPAKATHLIHWGVNLERFTPVPWSDKPAGLHIASLRAWEPNYRIEDIIHALALLRQWGTPMDAQLHLMGKGSLEPLLRQRVQELGLTQCVHFHGQLDDTQMHAVLGRCHVSVSIPHSDATSVSVLESMACGLPVIASDVPANRHWLRQGVVLKEPLGVLDRTGAQVPHLLAQALQEMMMQPLRAQEMGAKNRSKVESEGDRRVQMDSMALCYARAVGHTAAP